MKRIFGVVFAFLVLLSATGLSAQNAPLVVVGKAYCVQRAVVRVADVLIGGGSLKITSVDMRIGDRVTAGTRLIGYEAPLEQVIQEKTNLSGHRVTGSESTLQKALVELKKIKDANAEAKMMQEHGAVSPQDVHLTDERVKLKEMHIELLREKIKNEKAQMEQKRENTATKYGVEVDGGSFPKYFYEEAGIDGHILSVSPRLVPGAEFTPADKDILYEIGTLEKLLVRCAVHEIQALKLKPGDPVDIVFKAFPDRTFHSAISDISFVSLPAHLQQPSFYEVVIPLDNPDLLIKDGMRCDVTFRSVS